MKKIMFNDRYGLTKAVLEGRKTQTRRIITTDTYNRIDWKAFEEGNYDCVITDDAFDITDIRYLSKYRVGEEVAVAQSYKDAGISADDYVFVKWVRNSDGYYDDAYKKAKFMKGWSNKMFVRVYLMPHRIKITNVRVERLQNISDEDCLKEGIMKYNYYGFLDGNIKNKRGIYVGFGKPKEAYAFLIDKICGRGTWDSNPWVFIYDFQLIK